ncbi:hypothetical protein CAPTEDRAFT_193779 [Capitella teleta]|uniref:Uncharacterized protein n=1 Tax=Capitella teleta TaxID=283909 RepID=R7V9N9_CAPTE|nr:hypothetical protein CAPTEDRAFT_193779 [Capitella teleta]|eukprot:ELU15299.1 hypothetical protein CAPTEDRAFT_193779 [Capitella teleta]
MSAPSHSTLAMHCESAIYLGGVRVKMFNMTIQVVPNGAASGEKLANRLSPSISTAVVLITVTPSGKPVTLHQRAMVLGTIAEHSLPFTLSPAITDLAKELARDPTALSALHMDHTSASYKLTHGLKKTWEDKLDVALCSTTFSLNLDKTTSKTNARVLGVLRYTAETVFEAVDNIFTQRNIPYCNLISMMIDSCGVMWGLKSGLETRIRLLRAPHLLDVDEDSCHTVHNACKKFAAPFSKLVEGLLGDLHTDHQWYVLHRWLSVYNVSLDTLRMWDALMLFYYAFLSKEAQRLYQKPVLDVIMKYGLSSEGRKRLKSIWAKGKNVTPEGRKKKERICEKVILKPTEILLINFWCSVLPLLKDYVLLFQKRDPMIHKLHDQQEETFRKFLTCFIKPEKLINFSAPKMKQLKLKQDSFLKKPFIGKATVDLLNRVDSKTRNDFYSKSSFNTMGGILSSKAPRTAVETYESYQCVKYHLKNANQSTKEMFYRKDVKNSAVDASHSGSQPQIR